MTQFRPGRNCWRVEPADRLSFIVDGKDYFRALREALIQAERLVMLIGWDFDFAIDMLPGESDKDGNAPDGLPNAVGPFLDAIAARRPDLDIYLLKWSGGALIAPGRVLPSLQVKFMSPDQIHLAFDGRHPIGACHHQKLVAIDDCLAFCGGIDLTAGRWDDRQHLDDNPLRSIEDGRIMQPWHDASAVFSGKAAEAIAVLARRRWLRANDEELDDTYRPGGDIWPDSIDPMFRDQQVAIARTEPPDENDPMVDEIEQMYLDAIAEAGDSIYLESQYFCADTVTRALERRIGQPDCPEIVVINPHAAQKAVEDHAMHIPRSSAIRRLQRADRNGRFRILYPVTEAGQPIYVHAKVMVVDGRVLRVGSSNIDRRSMGFDTECDIAMQADGPDNQARVRDFRDGLIAEHLGTDLKTVQDRIDDLGGIIPAIESLMGGPGKTLHPLHPRRHHPWFGEALAESRVFDPRYRRSAQARLGITSRHIMIGAALLGAGALAWRWGRKGGRD